ncbi:MAG: hypothetical protein AAF351_02680 [Pseudomonadota bacterium]
MILTVLYERLGEAAELHEAAVVVPIVIASLYIPVYLFVSMRRVYGQGRLVTFVKYIALLAAYLAGSFFILLMTLLTAAFSN